mmetsp:Transcript_39555/g.73742  ORF Transcript_39555/g.73742 Transcript_39555/m.73742 type:complete len:231 (-) Transcript_39555:215-907(-)
MTLTLLREAALVVAQHKTVDKEHKEASLDLTSLKQLPCVSWQRIDAIGGDLYICGAAALDKPELRRLGVGCILNCGGEDIYTRSYASAEGTPLSKQLDGFQVEVLDAEDVEDQDMRLAWQKAATVIDEALGRGDGVVVHCAQGVSRSSSTCIAYLMMRESLPLEAAFRRVFQARDYIRPNVGFWRQLRELDVQLRGRPPQLAGHDAAGEAMARLDAELAQRRSAMAAGWL